MKRRTTEEWIVNAKKAHAGKVPDDWYDYSRVDYIRNNVHIEIGCKKHGYFWQVPSNHLRGTGCPKCGAEQGSMSNSTLDKFIKKATKVYGDCYDYSEVDYVGYLTPVKIGCKKHGYFWQRPFNHLQGNQGCSLCETKTRKLSAHTKSTAQFIIDAESTHTIEINGIIEARYVYDRADYIRNNVHIEIGCKKHGYFWQRPSGHLAGHGCAKCAYEICSAQFLDVPTNLYYIKLTDLDGTEYWKVGTTIKTMAERFPLKGQMEHIDVLLVKQYDTGRDAYLIEQYILNRFQAYRAYNKEVSVIKGGGWTELFTEDVLSPLLARL